MNHMPPIEELNDSESSIDIKTYVSIIAQMVVENADSVVNDFLNYLSGLFIDVEIEDYISNSNTLFIIFNKSEQKLLEELYNACKITLAARDSVLMLLGYPLDKMEENFGNLCDNIFYEIEESNEFMSAISGKASSMIILLNILFGSKEDEKDNKEDNKENNNSDNGSDNTKQVESIDESKTDSTIPVSNQLEAPNPKTVV